MNKKEKREFLEDNQYILRDDNIYKILEETENINDAINLFLRNCDYRYNITSYLNDELYFEKIYKEIQTNQNYMPKISNHLVNELVKKNKNNLSYEDKYILSLNSFMIDDALHPKDSSIRQRIELNAGFVFAFIDRIKEFNHPKYDYIEKAIKESYHNFSLFLFLLENENLLDDNIKHLIDDLLKGYSYNLILEPIDDSRDWLSPSQAYIKCNLAENQKETINFLNNMHKQAQDKTNLINPFSMIDSEYIPERPTILNDKDLLKIRNKPLQAKLADILFVFDSANSLNGLQYKSDLAIIGDLDAYYLNSGNIAKDTLTTYKKIAKRYIENREYFKYLY